MNGTRIYNPSNSNYISSAAISLSTTSSTFQDVGSVTLSTSGRPVLVVVTGDANTGAGSLVSNTAGNAVNARILYDGTEIARWRCNIAAGGAFSVPASFSTIYAAPAGTSKVYKLQINSENNTNTVSISSVYLIVYEL